MAKKKILLGSLLFSIFSISISLIPTSCSKVKIDMKDISNIITDRDVGDEGSDVPSEEQLWDWIVADNPLANQFGLTINDLLFFEPSVQECHITTRETSSFHGSVDLTYNTIDPDLFLYIPGVPTIGPIDINLIGKEEDPDFPDHDVDIGTVNIGTGNANYFNHYYSFRFFTDAENYIDTPQYGGSATGYHFANLRHKHGYTPIQVSLINNDACLRVEGSTGYATRNYHITFDIIRDTDSSIFTSFTLNFVYHP